VELTNSCHTNRVGGGGAAAEEQLRKPRVFLKMMTQLLNEFSAFTELGGSFERYKKRAIGP
jgi:hypothetical protein